MKNTSQHLPQGEPEFRRNTKDSHILKPLLIGCLTGQFHALLLYWNRLLEAHFIESSGNSTLKKSLPEFKMANQRMLRINLLFGSTYTTASLGVFEILTEKLRTNNNERPLSLCEEACCGLTSGAAAAFVWYPLYSPYATTAPHNLSYGRLFSILYHFARDKGAFALWKGSGLYVGKQITANVGMLATYNRSKNYLVDSTDLSQWDAEMRAGIISGFFAAACSYPCEYVKAIKNVVQENYRRGDKHSYRKIPLYISRILTPYSGSKFYSGFPRAFGRWASYCMVQWFIFEQIHVFEKSMESGTGDFQTSYLGKD